MEATQRLNQLNVSGVADGALSIFPSPLPRPRRGKFAAGHISMPLTCMCLASCSSYTVDVRLEDGATILLVRGMSQAGRRAFRRSPEDSNLNLEVGAGGESQCRDAKRGLKHWHSYECRIAGQRFSGEMAGGTTTDGKEPHLHTPDLVNGKLVEQERDG